ncbi:MAG: putative DNA binding domain-containing protein [Elusimicrobia bacterium]|nr:putative DNA binding domain-containing protein [Elusimicrobiota bacterium]
MVEFKESFDDEAIETVAAFANARGGTLLLGVTDAGVVKGTMVGKESIRDWANQISQATHVNPRIREMSYQGKTLVIVEVTASAARPHPSKGRYFVRIGKSNRQMTEDDLTRMVLAKVGMTWDAVPEPRASMADAVLCLGFGQDRSLPARQSHRR